MFNFNSDMLSILTDYYTFHSILVSHLSVKFNVFEINAVAMFIEFKVAVVITIIDLIGVKFTNCSCYAIMKSIDTTIAIGVIVVTKG